MTASAVPAHQPRWPDGLTDTSPLPFNMWRVLHHVDGRRTTEEVALRAQVAPQDVALAVDQATSWASRALTQAQPVTPAQTQRVVKCLIPVLGPMAEFVVEDTLDELGAGTALGALLSRLASDLTEAQRQTFVQHLRVQGLV